MQMLELITEPGANEPTSSNFCAADKDFEL